ncbi:MAG: exosortase/archaeosortase family protein [Prevotellaceae bacterium]|jgi:exosortase/archaeosortase family protein|nr:exosortase/archaeosortase family protein [Prevotellaceae bacterium]
MNSTNLPPKLQPYQGVIYFIIMLLLSHFLWKFTVLGDDTDTAVTFFGIDISAPFIYFSNLTATISVQILHFFGSTVELYNDNILRYTGSHTGVRVIWGCSGLKQAYIFLCIMLFHNGSFTKKLWYIPLSLLLLFGYNVLRITLMTAAIKHHPEWFHFLHEYLFKYLYYGLLFGLYLHWDAKTEQPKTESTNN